MSAKPLIVGEAPNKKGRPGDTSIAGRCGKKLAELCGCTLDEYLDVFERRNVLSTYPGASGKGSAFSSPAIKRRATILRRAFRPGRTVILLGYRSARAFGVKAKYFEPVKVGSAAAIVVPHPSGINRWYNDPANVRKMKRFMQGIYRAAR